MTLFYLTTALLFVIAASAIILPLWQKNALKSGLFISLVLGALSYGGYTLLGSPGIIADTERYHQWKTSMEHRYAAITEDIRRHPDRAGIWFFLRRYWPFIIPYGDYEKEAALLKQKLIKTQGDPQTLVMYAVLLTAQANATVTPEAKKALEMALLQEKNWAALYLLAIEKHQRGKTKEAIADLQRLQAAKSLEAWPDFLESEIKTLQAYSPR